jgi:DNA-binding NarL/FixJ family response regulator
LKALIDAGDGYRVTVATTDLATYHSLTRPAPVHVLVAEMSELVPSERELLSSIRASGIRVIALNDEPASTHGLVNAVVSTTEGAAGLLKCLESVKTLRRVLKEPRTAYGERLTPRERDVAKLIAVGLPNRDIASKLDLREQSVKNLASVIMRKLSCDNRVQVALHLSQERSVEHS